MRLIVFAFLLSWTCYGQAQLNGKYNFIHLDQTDGLLHPNIFGISQDAQGYIWILTYNGLQRFDGTRFVNYPEVVQHTMPGTLGESNLYLDTLQNQISVGRSTTVEQFDLSTHQIKWIPSMDYIMANTSADRDTYFLDNGKRWLISDIGFTQYPPNANEADVVYLNPFPFQSNQAKYFMKDSITGRIWTGMYDHIVYGDPSTHHIKTAFTIAKNADGLASRFIFIDHERNLWISTWSPLFYRYNLVTGELSSYSLADIHLKTDQQRKENQNFIVQAFFEDRQHQLWIGTDNAGLLAYDRQHDVFNAITADDRLSNGIRYVYQIKCLYQDREDNIWVGTDQGISIFNPYHANIRVIRHEEGLESSLSSNDITDVIETAQGEILVATWGGGITVFDQDWNFIRQIHFPGKEQLNQVWCFAAAGDGTIWAGAQQGYLHHYDPLNKSFSTTHPPETEGNTITCMATDHSGNIYLGLHNGHVTMWDNAAHKFYPLQKNTGQKLYSNTIINHLFVDPNQRVWVSTETNLKEYDIHTHQYIGEYNFGSASDSTQETYTLLGIDELNDSTLMVGAIYGGLFQINKNTGMVSRYPCCQNLEPRSVAAIRHDDHGHVWFTSNTDLFNIDVDSQTFTQYQTQNLAIQDVFNSCQFYALRDGRWITSTPSALVCFNPASITAKSRFPHQLAISGFSVKGQYISIDSCVRFGSPLKLSYRQNFIAVEYAALRYNQLTGTDYAYRLSDVDEDWIEAGAKNTAEYTGLKPGHYRFEVKGRDGQETYPVTSFTFIISPPWWATTWFRILIAVSIGTLVYMLIRRRIQSIRKEATLQQRVTETEMMALRSQMNPHFIFNCINSIDAMIQQDDKYRATLYLNKFAKLIRNVLDTSRQNSVALTKDLETLQLYVELEKFRHPDQFTVDFNVEPELWQSDYKVPPLIIQPYVENAILHGLRGRQDKKGELHIRIRKSNHHLVYEIEDNGVGRSSNAMKNKATEQGLGMQMSSDRIRLFNQEERASVLVEDLHENGQATGTKVTVTLNMQ